MNDLETKMADRNTPEMVNWAQFFPSEDGKLGAFLTRSGRPINCRLDFRLTRLEELKKAACVVSELNKELQRLAYEVDGDPVLRVMLARSHFSQAQFELRYVDPAHVLKAASKRTADAAQKLKKVRKEKKLPIVLGDVLGFGISTD
jgi:SNF2 family DNA or RNA helicase